MKNTNWTSLVVGSSLALLAAGCGLSQANVDPGQALGRSELRLESKGDGVYELRLLKSALGNGSEFLMSTSATSSLFGDPAFAGMLSRVVHFKRADGKVQMLESLKGTAVDPTLMKPTLLMSFPIVSEDDTSLGLGFNEGAANIFLSSDWWASDFGDAFSSFVMRNTLARLEQAYVDEGTTDAKGRIRIRQVALADFWGMTDALELRYAFEPYRPDASYVPLPSRQDFRRVGFFESAPLLRKGTSELDVFVARFNPTKPVTFAISANTPKEVAQAIRDGVLYWNRARGQSWLRVIDAPEGITAPDLDYNLIQWVDEKGLLMAYADAQLDPLTGEVRNAQVFLPSGWYFASLDEAVNAFGRLPKRSGKLALKQLAVANGHRLKEPLASARAVGGCARHSGEQFARAARTMMRLGLSDAAVRRVGLDWLRTVVAHEVGHTLGMRHNFAGSLGSNIARGESDALMNAYFLTGAWPSTKLPGSSVMEYPRFEDDLASGARIRLGHAALPYDVMAMGALYDGKPVPSTGPAFCTDGEAMFGPNLDCRPFDGRAALLEGLDEDADEAVKNAAVEYLYYLRLAKTHETPGLFVANNPAWNATLAVENRFGIAQLLSNSSRLLAADRAFELRSVSDKVLHEDTLRRVRGQVAMAGGYDKLFEPLPANFEATFNAQLESLLVSPWYLSGVTVSGKPWKFSPNEVQSIRAASKDYVRTYAEAATKAELAALSLSSPMMALISEQFPDFAMDFMMMSESKWDAPAVGAGQLEKLLAARMEHVLTASTTKQTATIVAPGEDETAEPKATVVQLPVFTYDTKLRVRAAGLLDPMRSDVKGWAYDLRLGVSNAFTGLLLEATGVPLEMLMLEGSSDNAKRWILENREVSMALQMTMP